MSQAAEVTPGVFVTLEGGEGTGKSTQQRRLAARLARSGVEVVCTREPGGSPGAEAVRALVLSPELRFGALAEALLFCAARADHLESLIRPALAAGRWVLCDRFADSTRAYQGVAEGLDAATVATLERLTIGPTRPHLTLLLDMPPEDGLARAARRRGAGDLDRFEREALAFHRRLRDAFLAIAAREPVRFRVVDALGSEEEIEERLWVALAGALGNRLPAASPR